ncbi:alpha/beta hydrolase [soil metagenome]
MSLTDLNGVPMQDTYASWPPDPAVQALLTQAVTGGAPPLHRAGVLAARERVASMRAVLPPPPAVAATWDESVGDEPTVPVRIYRTGDRPSVGSVVYLHGGGWTIGGIDESDGLCRHLAHACGVDVVNVGYRLAPEHPFPAAIDDVSTVLAWLESSRPGEPIAVVGDSAGGNLAAVVCRRLRDRGNSPVVLQVLVYPVTDSRMTTPSFATFGGEEFLLSAADMRWFWDNYADPTQRLDPDASPILADDLTGLPPALVLVAEYDALCDESIAYARRLATAGVEVTVDRYENMIHGFFALVGLLDQAKIAVESVGSACSSALRAQPPRA